MAHTASFFKCSILKCDFVLVIGFVFIFPVASSLKVIGFRKPDSDFGRFFVLPFFPMDPAINQSSRTGLVRLSNWVNMVK